MAPENASANLAASRNGAPAAAGSPKRYAACTPS